MAQKVWAVGEEVLAADFNAYVQNQVVPAFASTAQRDSQWPAPPAGALCIVTANGAMYERLGGAWYTPYAVLAQVERTSSAGPAVAEAIFMSTPAFTLPSLRRVRVEAYFRGIAFASGSTATFMRLRDGTTTAGAELTQVQVVPSVQIAGGVLFGRSVNLAAGSHQISLSLESQAGTGNTVQGAATYPIWIEARDVGAL